MAKSNILLRSKLKKAQNLAAQEKLSEAKTAYTQLYKTNKSNHTIGLELAIIHRKLGEFDQTKTISKGILQNDPNNTQAHHIYGSALQCLGDMDNAILEYRKALQLDPNFIQAHYFLGNIYQITGNAELAADSFYKAIKLKPDFFEALNNLSAVLVDLRRSTEAKDIIERALKINPHSNQLLCNVSGFYLLENNLPKALSYAKKVYSNDPLFVDALELIGKISYQSSEYDKALEFYNKAYKLNHNEDLIGYIAQILERRGEFDKANDLIEPLIKSGNTNYPLLMTYSALSRKFNNQKSAIEAIENKIGPMYLDKPSLANLHSELGKQYDALENYDKAFYNYNLANQIERELNKEIEYLNEERLLNNTNKEDIDNWFEQYPADFWNNLPSSNNTSDRPIFIIGMFRSGTTLCEQILASHPDVHGAGELPDISSLSYKIGENKYHDQSPASLTNATEKQFANAAESYLTTLDSHSTVSKRVVDKMPSNFFHVGLISRLFPNAHFVHMIRDPRDVCTSMFFQRFGAQMTFTTDLDELADYHLTYQRVMQYWKHVLGIKIHDVVYEDLLENQETMTRELLEFCDLDWSEQCLSFYKSKRDVNTPSYDQVRKPLYKKSVARWKHYEKHLKPLLNKLGSD